MTTTEESIEAVMGAAVEFVTTSSGLHDVNEVRAEFEVNGMRYRVEAEVVR